MRYLSGVVTLRLKADKCVGCGRCMEVCPHAIFTLDNGKAHIADRDACMECGACAVNCPVEAIAVQSGEGCATGIITGAIRGTEAACDCSKDTCC